jgi:hypothetical protein
MYEQTQSAYSVGLHSVHKACIHFKSITPASTSSDETCDPLLMQSYTNSLERTNTNLVSSKQNILLWAWQYFHYTLLQNMAESISIYPTTLPHASLCSHLHKQTIVFSCTSVESHYAPNAKLLYLTSLNPQSLSRPVMGLLYHLQHFFGTFAYLVNKHKNWDLQLVVACKKNNYLRGFQIRSSFTELRL